MAASSRRPVPKVDQVSDPGEHHVEVFWAGREQVYVCCLHWRSQKFAGFVCKVPAAKRSSVAQGRGETAVKKIDTKILERDDEAHWSATVDRTWEETYHKAKPMK